MASANKVLTVDLGTSTIKFAEIAIGRNGALTLLKFGVAELGLDPNKEEDRAKFITPTLSKLFKDHGVKGGDVMLSISGQSVFMRFVKLPPVSADQVEQVVRFEAQQNVPFPIDEVTWDYQMMPARSAGSTEAEAVIVAIKKDVIEGEVDAVERTGVQIKKVDVAPFALLNAFRYSELQTDECTLIIDMGARSTNLVFVEKNSFWIRNVPIAGNQISQSICNEMQEPFVSAEMLKKGKGFVSLGGVYADPDDLDAARISKLIRSTMTRLHVDINRSIAYYRTTLSGAPPKRVFLTGGSTQLPYLDLFIADKLSLPVSYFNPLRNVSLNPSLNMAYVQQNSCYTAELVGMALRLTGSSPAEINLEAPKLATRAYKSRKLPYYVTALVAWSVMLICVCLYYLQQTTMANDTAAKLSDSSRGLMSLAPKVAELAKEQDARKQVLESVVRLGNQRNAWPEIITALNEKIPEGIWITEMVPVPSAPAGNSRPGDAPRGGPDAQMNDVGMLVISGLYHANEKTQLIDPNKLHDFVLALADVPIFDIDKNNINATLSSYTTKDSDQDSFAQKFAMRVKLRAPISLRPDK